MKLVDAIAHLEQLAAEKQRDTVHLVMTASPFDPHADETLARIANERGLLVLGAAACRILVRLCNVPGDTDVDLPAFTSPEVVERFVDEVQARALCVA